MKKFIRQYMKPPGVIVLLAAIAVLLLYCGISAASGVKDGTLLSTGEYVEYHKPDTLLVSFAVETLGKSAADAVSKNAEKAAKVVSELKAIVDKDRGGSVSTTDFSVNPEYRYSKNVTRIVGFRATNTVRIRTGKTEAAGEIIDRAIKSGADSVNSINFTLPDADKYCSDVLEKAVREARNKASEMAGFFDVKLGRIKEITYNCGNPTSVFFGVVAGFANERAPSTPIESGDVPVSASVNVTYYIEGRSI